MLGFRLRKARERANLMQKDAAHKVGISNVTLSQYEKGIRNPDPHILVKLADLYDVSTDWLLGRTDNPTPVCVADQADEEPVDIRQLIREKIKKAHWGGHPLTEEDKEFLTRIIDVVIDREAGKKETAENPNAKDQQK